MKNFDHNLQLTDPGEKFKKMESRKVPKLNGFLEEALIGIILGDGHLEKRGRGPNSHALLTITFAVRYVLLAQYIYGLFIFLVNKKGFRFSEVQSGEGSKYFGRIIVRTVNLPLLTYYHNIFYKLIDNKYKKIIPLNIIDFLTPVSLAFFIMGDGNYNTVKKVIRLYTNSYTKLEVEYLSKALNEKLGIRNRIEKDKLNYIIVIPTSQVPIVQALVKEHVHPSFYYRIGLQSLDQI
jgi:LAGLIDADG DNA endonuclease family